jgi:hypothetical protein
MMRPMAVDRAELSSIVSTLEDLSRRMSRITEQAIASRDDSLAHDLTAVERALVSARRRLERVAGR